MEANEVMVTLDFHRSKQQDKTLVDSSCSFPCLLYFDRQLPLDGRAFVRYLLQYNPFDRNLGHPALSVGALVL
jgi:hypothetical protein